MEAKNLWNFHEHFSYRNEAFKIRTAADLQAERIRKEAAELAAKVHDDNDNYDHTSKKMD